MTDELIYCEALKGYTKLYCSVRAEQLIFGSRLHAFIFHDGEDSAVLICRVKNS